MMENSNWKEVAFFEIANITMGQSPSGDTCNDYEGFPLLNGPTEFGIKHPKEVQFTRDSKKECKPMDILFCVRGSTTGKMNWADKKYSIGRGLAAINHKNGSEYNYFVKGVLDYNLELLLASATGSTFPNLSRHQLENLQINLPPLHEQKAIASVLSSLDDKIDLLHQQNQTLEALAETLFRQWFVEEADEGWEVSLLGDLIDIKYGKDHKKLAEGQFPVYGSGGLMRNVEKFLYEGESVLIPRKGTLNNVMYVDEAFWTVDTMFYSVMKKSHIAKFIYQFIKQKDLLSMNVGSAVPSMTTAILNNMLIDVPPRGILIRFDKEASTLYNKIKSNQTQIRTLESLRDTLLPKLMSGEVRVKIDSN